MIGFVCWEYLILRISRFLEELFEKRVLLVVVGIPLVKNVAGNAFFLPLVCKDLVYIMDVVLKGKCRVAPRFLQGS